MALKLFLLLGQSCKDLLTGPFRAALLLSFSVLCYVGHILLCPFPKRDALQYLYILHYWNMTGSYTQMLEKFPKFGLLLFSFFPLKWADMIGLPLYPASICWMLLLSTLSVYLFYKIVLLITGEISKAMWCGALLALHPMILYYAGCLMRDTPYLMFSLLLILTFLYAVRVRKWYLYVLGGAILAMCVLCRFESWELLVLFPVYILFYAKKNRLGKREIVLWYLLTAAGFTAVILLMLSALDNLPLLFAKGKFMFLSFFPDWMHVQ